MTAALDSVAIVGVGLIGGSIGRGLRERRLARRVIGIGRRAEPLQAALACGAIDEATTDLEQGVAAAQRIIICTPVDTIADFTQRVAVHCPPDAIITDAGSTKAQIVATVSRQLRPDSPPFIGSHPMAGSEKTGVTHADPHLLRGRVVIITPTAESPAGAIAALRTFWESLDARVEMMSPADHDQAVAAISHLPHAVASLLAAATPSDRLSLAASGWLDTTRIAAGDVELWRQIFAQNRESLLPLLRSFATLVHSFADALERSDDAAITKLLALGKHQRDALAD